MKNNFKSNHIIVQRESTFVKNLIHKEILKFQKPIGFSFCSKKLAGFLMIVMSVFNFTAFAQVFECGVIDTLSQEAGHWRYDNCEMGGYDDLCIRIQFHYLNNTSDPSLAPSDAFYFDLLQKINEKLAPGKIRFSFDDNCIHKVNLSAEFSDMIKLQTDVGKYTHSADPAIAAQMAFADDAINVYTLQQVFPDPKYLPDIINVFYGSYPNHIAVVPLDRFPLIVHELGHTLGMVHTFAGDGLKYHDPPLSEAFLCKDPGAYIWGNKVCDYAQDNLCDTGLDTWTIDADNDNHTRDNDKWADYSTCTQSADLLSTYYPDECYDVVNPWHIPIDNFMSYYKNCRTSFTPCQFRVAHEKMSHKPSLLLICDQDPYLGLSVCTVPDITINVDTKWINDTKTFCPGQKIIIRPGVKLTIENCILTRKITTGGPNTGCSKLFYEILWDGIYIEGNPMANGHQGLYGELEITNSTVEYSKNGIQANNGFLRIRISSSTFQNNMEQINVSYPYTHTSAANQQV
ncbi:MAG: hypothetical protein WBP41_15780 [Saprospiraceae bacterium]